MSTNLESQNIWGSSGDTTGNAQGSGEQSQEQDLPPEVLEMTDEQIRTRIRVMENNLRYMDQDKRRLQHDVDKQKNLVNENKEKIKLNKQLPYLVGHLVELLDLGQEEDDEDGAIMDEEDQRKNKTAVVKTSTRQTVYLPIIGLVDSSELHPGDLIGVNKDSYLVLEKLPTEYDSRVKAMELDEKPKETYSDIGGCDKQIEELVEAVVLPMTHAEKFQKLGVQAPKGVLLHGPPGTGKTLLARACANQTDAIFLKLAGPSLVQMFIGDGAKMIRDAFDLAKEKIKETGKSGAIIFIDEVDAIGTKRFNSDQTGDREVQRTMLELLNQLDGFASNEKIKVIAATNRVDTLDPALLRSGRLDRKVELPHPPEDARARILQIHSRKMNYKKDEVNFEELARSTEDFNGAQLKAVCVEAGMLALRREATEIGHQDYVDGISEVQMKKRQELQYYA
eukprot:gb/GECG01016451.1/.p1 GENE.gb/GECG01016451.1/~~gb/GECG01016451.1/.p1  ORF type:complete len:451 (+),score=75.67 gb/GECG01016451.1/:1-1353(+)